MDDRVVAFTDCHVDEQGRVQASGTRPLPENPSGSFHDVFPVNEPVVISANGENIDMVIVSYDFMRGEPTVRWHAIGQAEHDAYYRISPDPNDGIPMRPRGTRGDTIVLWGIRLFVLFVIIFFAWRAFG